MMTPCTTKICMMLFPDAFVRVKWIARHVERGEFETVVAQEAEQPVAAG